ncbi:MAG: site-specific integrase, partial [Candidatus Desulfofervidaceae bacterium]|nr:site-specific integrase [Candidatus Desulfofervidaceae bacterium]
EEELKKLLEVAPEHLRWALIVEFYTGCRPGPSELFALKWEDVDWKEGTITIYGSKTGSVRKVYLKREFLAMLRQKYENRDCEYIISYKGRQVKKLKTAWKTAKKKAGITRKLRLYDLRHAFATYLLAHGADLKAVSDIMGHHSTKMTADRYYQLIEDLKRKAVEKLPSLTFMSNNLSNTCQPN